MLKLAGKNLLSHKLRTILTIAGMVIGISAIIFLVSFAFGVEKIVTKEITSGNAYQLIDIGTGNSQIVKLNDDITNQIKQIPNIKSLETISNLAAKVKNEDGSSMDASLFGTTTKYMDWSGISVKWGENIKGDNPNPNDAVISTALFKFLNISSVEQILGKQVKLDVTVPKSFRENGESTLYENKVYNIIGVRESESPSIYVSINSFSEFDLKNYSQAKVEISSPLDEEKTRKQIENLGLRTEYVGATVSQINEVFRFFEIILGSFGLIALIVASLAMFNTLTISLLERTREVALLKILGMKKKVIETLFLAEAIMMGIIGGTAGIIMGIIFSDVANYLLNSYALRSGGQAARVFVHPFWFIVVVMLFSILVGFLTGIYPAKRATRVDALDVMRYE